MALLKVTVAGKTYEIEPQKLNNQEVREIERFLGMTITEFRSSRLEGDHVTIWVWLGRRAAGEPGLRLADVVFDWDDVTYELIEDPTDQPITPDDPAAPSDPTPQPEEPEPLPG